MRLILLCLVSTIVTAVVEYSIGLTKNERKFIVGKINNKNINNNMKDKYLKMKELLIKMGGVKLIIFTNILVLSVCVITNK